MSKDIRAYAVKQDVVDYNAENLVMLQAQLINKDYVGKVMVEKVSKDAGGYAAGKYYIPGVALNFGEHPVEAGHRILTEELEVEDREIKYIPNSLSIKVYATKNKAIIKQYKSRMS